MPPANQPPPEGWTFRGVTSPNTTQVPDQYLDELLPLLTGAELKVLLYVTRRTFGFKKDADNIALSQMLGGITTSDGRVLDYGVGLTKKTLLQAINSLEAKRIIRTERRSSAERGFEPTTYRLNIASTPEKSPSSPLLGEKVYQGVGVKTTPSPRGKNYAIQHTVKQQTEHSNSNDRNLDEAGGREDIEPGPTVLQPQHTDSPVKREQAWDELPEEDAATVPQHPASREATAVGSLLKPPPQRRTTPDEDRLAIGGDLAQIAAKLGDNAPPRASLTRALRLYHDADISQVSFRQLLFEALATTQAARPHNRMAYFFRVLEDRLGLRPEATPGIHPALPTSLNLDSPGRAIGETTTL